MAIFSNNGNYYGQGQYGMYGINPQQATFNTFSDDWGQGLLGYSPAQNMAATQGLDANNMFFNPNVQGTNISGMQGGGPGLAGYLSAGAGILQGIGGLASAYTAYKGLQLAKDQFGFQKGLANRNLANQAKITNNAYDNAAQVAAGMIGGGSYNPATDSQGSYGMTDQAVVDRYANKAKGQHVDGSPIK